jgi:hypothetical protein
MLRTYIDAADAAARLGISLAHFYALLRQGRVIGARDASEAFRKQHVPAKGAARPPSTMFDPILLAIRSAPHGNRKYAEDERVRVFTRSTDLESDRWKLAAEKTGTNLWSRVTLNEAADKLGIPRDPAKVAALIKGEKT